MARIFVSYRHVEPDQTVAMFLKRYLSDLDHEVFFDREDLKIGTRWHENITERVRRSEWFIPLVSLAYLNSGYIIEHELSPAAALLKQGSLTGLLHVNLAYDGDPPEAVRQVLHEVQFAK